MSILDIFKKTKEKKSSKTIEQKEAECNFRVKWLTIHIGMVLLSETEKVKWPNEKRCEELSKSISEIVAICHDSDYKEACKVAEKEYVENGHEMTEEIKRMIENPHTFDVEQFVIQKRKVYYENYVKYWENEIGLLKRKDAITKRRKYIEDHIDEMIEDAKLYVPECVNALREYKAFNHKKISEMQ